MYLSRLVLPLTELVAQRLLADPHALHSALMQAMPTPCGRVLFRIEPPDRRAPDMAVVLVQSETQPRWDTNPVARGARADSRQFDPSFIAGQRLRFRLRANPTVKKKEAGKENGKRQGLITEEAQQAWLKRKGEQGGFRIEGCVVVDEKMLEGQKAMGERLAFRSVRYEGILVVTNPDLFKHTLAAGIGSGKAFGFGLLSVARA